MIFSSVKNANAQLLMSGMYMKEGFTMMQSHQGNCNARKVLNTKLTFLTKQYLANVTGVIHATHLIPIF